MTDDAFKQEDLAAIASHEVATAARVKSKEDRIRALAEWDALTKSSKAKMGLATTNKAFADQWGVHPNQIGKDRKSALYARALDEAKEKAARQLDPRGTAALTDHKREELANDDLAVYEQLKGQLATDAMSGDQKALEQWMKLFGAPFIQEENKRVDEVANLDDRELVEELIELVDINMLISILKDRGQI